MTILHIQIMLHYYCRVEPYAKNEPHRYSEAVLNYTKQLVLAEMIQPSTCPDVYVVTEKGRAYINALKSIKEPIKKFTWEQP